MMFRVAINQGPEMFALNEKCVCFVCCFGENHGKHESIVFTKINKNLVHIKRYV